MMMVLVTYDVHTQAPEGAKRLRRVAKLCQDHGQRVQYSVFECWLSSEAWVRLRAALIATIDESSDSLRFYFLGAKWKCRYEHIGAKPGYDPEGALIV